MANRGDEMQRMRQKMKDLKDFRYHVDRMVNHARTARAFLRPVLASELPKRTKLGIYKIRSRFTYAAPWYALTSQAKRKRLQAPQNILLRVITGAGRYVRNDAIARDLRVESLEEFVVRLSSAMFNRADSGPQAHLRDLAVTRKYSMKITPRATTDEEDTQVRTRKHYKQTNSVTEIAPVKYVTPL